MDALLVHVLDEMGEQISGVGSGGKNWVAFLEPVVVLKEHQVAVESENYERKRLKICYRNEENY